MPDLLPQESFGAVLSEFSRVLKPRGRVVISTMAFGSKWSNSSWQYQYQSQRVNISSAILHRSHLLNLHRVLLA